MGGAVFPPYLRPTSVGVNEDNGNFLQNVPCMHCLIQFPWPCSRPLLTHASARDSWILTRKSGSVSFGVTAPFSWVVVCTRLCLCLQESVSSVQCNSGSSMVGLMANSSKTAYATGCVTHVYCTQSPCPCSRPLLTHASTGDSQTLKGRSGSVSVGSLSPGAQKVLFELTEHLWKVLSLILNMISPLLQSCLGFYFALGCGVSFFGEIQHSPVNGCSAASCNFGVLTGEDECMSFYKLMVTRGKGQGGGSDLEFWIDMYTLLYLNR